MLRETVLPFARQHFEDNFRLLDDNAPAHRARTVRDFLRAQDVTCMDQPPMSPDCNPIEHLWDEMGRAVARMDRQPRNLQELRQALLQSWEDIPVKRLRNLVDSMPRRLAALRLNRGGPTRY